MLAASCPRRKIMDSVAKPIVLYVLVAFLTGKQKHVVANHRLITDVDHAGTTCMGCHPQLITILGKHVFFEITIVGPTYNG